MNGCDLKDLKKIIFAQEMELLNLEIKLKKIELQRLEVKKIKKGEAK